MVVYFDLMMENAKRGHLERCIKALQAHSFKGDCVIFIQNNKIAKKIKYGRFILFISNILYPHYEVIS